MRKPSSKKKPNRHTFRFKIEQESGPAHILEVPVSVKKGKKEIELILTSDHVRRALQTDGIGNTQKCAMAVCAKDHKNKFPHPVEGYVDWTYHSCHIVSKINRRTKAPAECVAYRHHDQIAKLFDNKAGLQKLLEILEKNGGSKVIRLYPPEKYAGGPRAPRKAREPGSEVVRRPGSKPRELPYSGARLRFAIASLGGATLD